MNKKEFIENIITEDWRQIRIDNMLIEKIVEHEMFLDQLLNSSIKEEQNRIIRIIKGRLLIKAIRNPIIRMIKNSSGE